MNNGNQPAVGLTIPMSDVAKQQAAASGFPQEPTVYLGLTKREAMAMAAMQGLIASNDGGAGDRLDDIPQYAVNIADALLEALEEPHD